MCGWLREFREVRDPYNQENLNAFNAFAYVRKEQYLCDYLLEQQSKSNPALNKVMIVPFCKFEFAYRLCFLNFEIIF